MLTTVVTVKGATLGILFCLMTASLSLFIWKCMESGMILRRYYIFLVYFWLKWHKKKDRWKRKSLKPLFLCIYCGGTWVNIFFFIFFIGRYEYLLFSLGLNYVFIEIGIKLIKFNH